MPWTMDKLAKETAAREKQIQELKDKHDNLARKFWEPYLELKGADIITLAPEKTRKKGKEASTFADIIKKKYGIHVNYNDITDCFWQGNTLVAKFNNMKQGSTYNKITYRPKNWKGSDHKVTVDRKKSPEEREILSILAWVRRRDEESKTETPRITWCRLLPRGVAFKKDKNDDLTFVRTASEAKDLMKEEEIREYENYIQELKDRNNMQ